MSARQLAQVGFILLGAYLLVESLAIVVGGFNDRPLTWQSGTAASPEAFGLNPLVLAIAAGLVGSIIFGLVPGAMIIAKSHQWAASLFPETGPISQVSFAVLYPLGLLLLGLNLGLQGFASIVGGVLMLAWSSDSTVNWGISTLGSGATYFVAGVLLFIMGRRGALNAA